MTVRLTVPPNVTPIIRPAHAFAYHRRDDLACATVIGSVERCPTIRPNHNS